MLGSLSDNPSSDAEVEFTSRAAAALGGKKANTMQRRIKNLLGLTSLMTVALLTAGCAGGTGDGGDAGGGEDVTLTYMAADRTCATDPLEAVDFDTAQSLRAPLAGTAPP